MNVSTDSSSNDKYRVYNEALYHAASCKVGQNCTFSEGRCQKVRASVEHFNQCFGSRRQTSTIEQCETCGKIWGLLCFHAKYCATAINGNCGVPHCNYLRSKIAQKQASDATELSNARDLLFARGHVLENQKDWPVERRKAAAESARVETLQMINDYREAKTRQSQVDRSNVMGS